MRRDCQFYLDKAAEVDALAATIPYPEAKARLMEIADEWRAAARQAAERVGLDAPSFADNQPPP